jgi:hypothetical protein
VCYFPLFFRTNAAAAIDNVIATVPLIKSMFVCVLLLSDFDGSSVCEAEGSGDFWIFSRLS